MKIEHDKKLWDTQIEQSKNGIVVSFSDTKCIIFHYNEKMIGAFSPKESKKFCEEYIKYVREKNEN